MAEKRKRGRADLAGPRKNDEFTVMIEDLSSDGAGIGHLPGDGFTVFVKDAVPGDIVRAKMMKRKSGYGFARLLSLETPSPDRVPPRCPAARQCGGCQIQALSYPCQLRFKEKMVTGNLERIGGISPEEYELLPILGMEDPWHYRNKAQYPVGYDRAGRAAAGFYAGRTHDIIDLNSFAPDEGGCALQMPASQKVLDVCREWMDSFQIRPYDEKTGRGLLRHILIRCARATGQIMVCLVINADTVPHEKDLVSRLCQIPGMNSICISPNRNRTNVIMGNEARCIWGDPWITDMIGEIRYHISALSFFQVNPVQTRRLYETALSFADPGPEDTVWDLYCGIGTISLFLAQKAKSVFGVEIIPQAVENARENAVLNGITNTRFVCGKAEDLVSQEHADIPAPDIVVVDPPRKGCERSLVEFIAALSPSRIVYVSCSSATLARDLKILKEKGYQVQKVRCCDMFPHTSHVESVVKLTLAGS